MTKNYKAYDIPVTTLGFYVDRLLYAMIKLQNKELKENNWDLQHAEFIVLKVLNVLGSASQSELANVMGKERSGISRTLALLEKKGYVERKPLNGTTNVVTPTEKGKEMVPAINNISNSLTDQAFKGFSEKRKASVLNSLDKLYRNVLLED